MTLAFVAFIAGAVFLTLATLAFALAVIAKRCDEARREDEIRVLAEHRLAAQMQLDAFLLAESGVEIEAYQREVSHIGAMN